MKSLVLSLALLAFTKSAIAQPTMVRTLFSSTEAGIRQQQPEPIMLAPGYGVSLSWLQASETIKKVWLSNPSFVTMDADGCLEGLNNTCNGDANVLHLRRIDNLNLPNIPDTNHSLLTVVTDGGFYLFNIIPSNTPHHLVYQVLDPPSNNQPRESNLFATLQRGRRVALREGYLLDGSSLDNQLSTFIGQLQSGGDIDQVMREHNISPEVISRLIELGS